VTGQNGIGQNGTDKMVRTKWHGYIFGFTCLSTLW